MSHLASVSRPGVLYKHFIQRLWLIPCLVSSSGKKTLPKEPELPKMPRKPLTPYIQFLVNNLDDVRRKNPVLSIIEVRNKLLEMWQSLTFEEKNLWSLEYEEKKAAYDVQYQEFVEKLDALSLHQTHHGRVKRNDKHEHSEAIKKNITKKMEKIIKAIDCESFGKPKLPANAFTLYLDSLKQDKVQFKNLLREGSVMWKKLPKEQKDIFQLKAKALQEQYHADLLEWETKMWEMDRSDLVRSHQRTRLRLTQKDEAS